MYQRTNWLPGEEGGMLITAARLNNLESGVVDADQGVEQLEGNIGTLETAIAAQAGKLLSGSGMPGGAVTAPVGTLYTDLAATNGARVWSKTTGTGNTGWAVIDGDTGWRDVSADLLNGWQPAVTAPVVLVRRAGVQVSWQIALNGAASTNELIINSPPGFTVGRTSTAVGNGYYGMNATAPNGVYLPLEFVVTSSAASYMRWSTPAMDRKAYQIIRGSLTAPTLAAWPNSLPGTPA